MTRMLIVLFSTVLTISCQNSNSTRNEAIQEEEEDRKNKIDDLAKKHNALQHWDTLRYNYTIEYQELFSDTNQTILIDNSLILDIYRKNNKYFIFGEARVYPFFYFRFELMQHQVKKLMESKVEPYRNRIAVVAKPTSIKQLQFILSTEYFDEHQYNVVLDGGGDYFLEGKYVDFVLLD